MAPDPFQVPYHVRVLAENGVDQARVAYAQFTDAMTQAMGMWLNMLPQNETTSRIKALHQRAVGFGIQNVEAGLTFASELAKAKNLPDVLSIQSRFMQMQMQNYDLQARELGRFMAAAAQS